METHDFQMEVVQRLTKIETGQFEIKTTLETVAAKVEAHENTLTFMKGLNYALHGLWALLVAFIGVLWGRSR